MEGDCSAPACRPSCTCIRVASTASICSLREADLPDNYDKTEIERWLRNSFHTALDKCELALYREASS